MAAGEKAEQCISRNRLQGVGNEALEPALGLGGGTHDGVFLQAARKPSSSSSTCRRVRQCKWPSITRTSLARHREYGHDPCWLLQQRRATARLHPAKAEYLQCMRDDKVIGKGMAGHNPRAAGGKRGKELSG